MKQAKGKNYSRSTNCIGRYRLEAKLGEGATGVVYRAYDPLMDRQVAIKSAKVESLSRKELEYILAEFNNEARIAGKFHHENIITIYDLVNDGSVDHIVMEYVPGRSVLDYMIATGPMDIDEALSIVYWACVGLSYVHYHGVIHRDIKPGNIMYHPAQGITKLMDFSVAHRIEDQPPRDTGTIGYMAPEHFDPKRRMTVLTDIFALGSTMYRMLTLEYPFSRKQLAYKILYEDPIPVTQLRPNIPPDVGRIVERAMAKDDGERFQSAAEFAARVKEVMERHYPGSELLNASSNYM